MPSTSPAPRLWVVKGGELEAHMPHFAAAVGLGTREPAGG
jgi:hypothetical protein